jgi:hypothetical protein
MVGWHGVLIFLYDFERGVFRVHHFAACKVLFVGVDDIFAVRIDNEKSLIFIFCILLIIFAFLFLDSFIHLLL